MIIFTFKPGTGARQVAEAAGELDRLPGLVASIRRLSHGADLGGFEHNADYALIADFDDLDGYVAYRDDPRHRQIITDTMEPLIEQYVRVQYALPDDGPVQPGPPHARAGAR